MRGFFVVAFTFAIALSSAAKADVYWSSIATACTADSLSIQNDRYSAVPDSYISPNPGNVDPITLVCPVSRKAGVPLPHILSVTYLDGTGDATSAAVKAQLIRVKRTNGSARAVVAEVSSDSFASKTVGNHKSDLFTHVLDFATNYYYVRIDIDRSLAKEKVRGIGVALESTCGDGIVTAPEACDDGNGTDGDGCSSACVVEGGYQCTGSPSVCTPIACLPENCSSSVCATASCFINMCQITPVGQFTPCGATTSCDGSGNCVAQCGDGLIDASEQCDDGNFNNGDGCSSSCVIESGYECSGTPSTCTLKPVLTVNVIGSAFGHVTSNDGVFNSCTGNCTHAYASGTTITLVAVATGGTFGGWSGACAGTGACVIQQIAADTAVTATFNQ